MNHATEIKMPQAKHQAEKKSIDLKGLFLKRNPKVKLRDLSLRLDGRLEWHCEHGVGHTVYAPKTKQDNGKIMQHWDHGCDGCCKKVKIMKQIK